MKNRNLKNNDNWGTPEKFLDELEKEFGFMFDPCPLQADFNGLEIEWKEKNFINPPYSRTLKEAFIRKAFEESKKGKLCVMLLPVSTSTKIFHEIIYPNAEIRFVKSRIAFDGINTFGKRVTNKCGMHDSMIVIFRPTQTKEENKFNPYWGVFKDKYGQKRAWIDSREKELEVYPNLKDTQTKEEANK